MCPRCDQSFPASTARTRLSHTRARASTAQQCSFAPLALSMCYIYIHTLLIYIVSLHYMHSILYILSSQARGDRSTVAHASRVHTDMHTHTHAQVSYSTLCVCGTDWRRTRVFTPRAARAPLWNVAGRLVMGDGFAGVRRVNRS